MTLTEGHNNNNFLYNIINILPLVEGVTIDYHKKKTECPSEGGVVGCGISLQYHPLL